MGGFPDAMERNIAFGQVQDLWIYGLEITVLKESLPKVLMVSR
jgi:hypothetical protein